MLLVCVRKLVAETQSRAGICFYFSGVVATAGAGRGAVEEIKGLDGGALLPRGGGLQWAL